MGRKRLRCIVSIGALLTCSLGAQQRTRTLRDFLRLLASSTNAARVVYLGRCDAAGSNRIIPPDVMVTNETASHYGVSMVRAMLRNTKDVSVEDSAGVVNVRIGAVDSVILRTRVASLRLTANQQYDPSEAIWALENSPDVQIEMRKRNARIAPMQGGLESMPAEGEPHLASTVQNLTVDEVLDQTARTFSGTVVWGECRQSNGQTLISITFVGH